jgi:hypothetical protein
MGPLLRDPAARSAVTKNKQLQNDKMQKEAGF